jgi:integrase
MTRTRNTLTAIQVQNAGPGKMSDGGGLLLDRTAEGGRWSWRYTFGGKRREMGLGTYPAVTLAAARKARDKWASVLLAGKDPITERARQIEAERAAMDRADPTLADMVQIVFESRKAGLRGDGERGRWLSPLAIHVLPKIGDMRISDIRQSDIHAALKPIWRDKPPTAEKAIQRLGIVFKQARLMGHDCDPFTVDAARHMLGEVRHEIQHIAATPWQEIPALYAKLDNGGAVHQCLRMMILTLVRSAGVRGMRFDEIEGDVWTVPAERMKAKEGKAQPFRVPLPGPALAIIADAAEYSPEQVFPGQGRKLPCITDTALAAALNDIGETGRPHGFRSSFRDWVTDTDACSYDVAETVLAHKVGGRVERSYARSDMLDRRRIVMDAWSRHVTGEGSRVVRLSPHVTKTPKR